MGVSCVHKGESSLLGKSHKLLVEGFMFRAGVGVNFDVEIVPEDVEVLVQRTKVTLHLHVAFDLAHDVLRH
jgi:hypothetical protein